MTILMYKNISKLIKMKVAVYFCQPDKRFNLITEKHEDIEACTYMGVVELSNFDLLENIPYESFTGEINIYPYLTTIGQARVENIYPAPPQITKYVALVINNDLLNVDTKLTYSTNNNRLDKEYNKLLETIRENLYSL